MPESRNPREIHKALQDRVQDIHPTVREELVFDPKTGQLVLTPEPSPDAVVATDIANVGFFCGETL